MAKERKSKGNFSKLRNWNFFSEGGERLWKLMWIE
jgi:hypothetical protein